MMKPFIPFLLLSILTSCIGVTSRTYLPQSSEKVIRIDYSKYIEQGYFLTQASAVTFDYIPLGSIEVILKSGIPENSKVHRSESSELVQYNVYDALDIFCGQLKEMGADGVLNLVIKEQNYFLMKESLKNEIYGNNYIVTGMAFKRKE